MICADSRVKKVGKTDKVERKEGDESEGTPVVEIHMNCPSNTGSWESQLELKQDTESASVISSSVDEVLGFEADDELSSETSSFLSEVDCDNGRGEARNCAQREPGPSGLHSTPNISLPPPRSSKWKEVYSKKLEQREQLAEEKLKRKPRRRSRTKRIHSQEEETHANKVRIIKKIKNAIKKAAAREPDSGHVALPTNETIARIFGVAVEDCRDSSSDNCSSSSSSASTRPSTGTSWNGSINSGEDLEQPRTGGHLREIQAASESVKNKPGKSVKTTSRFAASRESFSKSNKDFQEASTGHPFSRVKSTSESAKNGRKGANTTPSVNSWDSSTALDEESEEPKVERPHREIKSTSESGENGQTGATASSSSSNSWDSSTTLDEEFEEPKVGRPHREIKSTSESEGNGQTGATANPSSTNSWDSSTTSGEEFEQPNVACPWPYKVKLTSESEKTGEMGTTASPSSTKSRDSPYSEPTSDSASSWDSSTSSNEDFQKPSTPESGKNVQCGARTGSSSASSWNTSTLSHKDIDNLTLESANKGQKKARKARKWFRFKSNKVSPLQ